MNYELLLEQDSRLGEFLYFLYENEEVIADINLPSEWYGLVDEAYDERGNRIYFLTNRGMDLLIEGNLLAKFAGSKIGGSMIRGAGAVSGGVSKTKDTVNKSILSGGIKAAGTLNKISHGLDKGTTKVLGHNVGSKINNVRKGISSIAGHVGMEMGTHNPMAASALHGHYHSMKHGFGAH